MALSETLKSRWFYYSLLALFCWGAFALFAKFGSREIPPETMQFLFTIGSVPVCLGLLIARRFRLEKSGKGISYGVLNGVLSAVGGLALFAAYHTNGNTSVITASSSLYPVITVLLAITILREQFGVIQAAGLGFAALAIVIFSL
jgi:bacterial/archaeal transporter family protein